MTVLCLASYFKGEAFLRECKRQGCHVILLTREKLAGRDWPWDSIDERFLMPDLSQRLDLIYAVSYLARTRVIDRIVPLDDYDVELAAALREHLRIPGMGDTTARYFRDKLAMRVQARDSDIPVPDFVPVLNYDKLRDFMERVPPPWVLKPRSEAGAVGIKTIRSPDELWAWLNQLGDRQSFYVLEKFVAGDVFHVDSIISEREVVFSMVHRYGHPPLSVSHEGGIFTSCTLPRDSEDAQALQTLNQAVARALGMVRGVTHAEFIKGQADARFYFLEMAARVGGANIAEMVEFATGLNLWAEWARIEVAHFRREMYRLPELRPGYAGLILCLARQAQPDLSAYQDPEIAWRLKKDHHAGLIVASPDPDRIQVLLESYRQRFTADFLAVQPPLDTPAD
jgi:hypothetical protein